MNCFPCFLQDSGDKLGPPPGHRCVPPYFGPFSFPFPETFLSWAESSPMFSSFRAAFFLIPLIPFSPGRSHLLPGFLTSSRFPTGFLVVSFKKPGVLRHVFGSLTKKSFLTPAQFFCPCFVFVEKLAVIQLRDPLHPFLLFGTWNLFITTLKLVLIPGEWVPL